MESPFSSSSLLSTPGAFGNAPRPASTLARVLGLWPVLPAAILIGVVYHFIGRALDLFIIFPLVAGMCVGGVLASSAKKHKVRSKPLLLTLAVAGGFACFGARWASDALHMREVFIAARTAKWSAGNPATAPRIEAALRRLYSPARFLPLYVRFLGRHGTTLKSSSSYSSSSHRSAITGGAFWMFTLFKALLICGGAWSVAAKQAGTPFCAACDQWHGVELTALRALPGQATQAARIAAGGDFTALSDLPTQGATEKSYCDVVYTKCPGCATGELNVKRGLNGQTSTLWSGAISPPQMAQLEAVRAAWLA